MLCSCFGDFVNSGTFLILGICCASAFYPAVLLTYTCVLCDGACPGLSVNLSGWCGCECCLLRLLPIHVCMYPSWLDVWLPCSCSSWHMSHDSELSSAGLICCYAMSPRHVDAWSLVIHPLFAWQLGSLTSVLSWPSS